MDILMPALDQPGFKSAFIEQNGSFKLHLIDKPAISAENTGAIIWQIWDTGTTERNHKSYLHVAGKMKVLHLNCELPHIINYESN